MTKKKTTKKKTRKNELEVFRGDDLFWYSKRTGGKPTLLVETDPNLTAMQLANKLLENVPDGFTPQTVKVNGVLLSAVKSGTTPPKQKQKKEEPVSNLPVEHPFHGAEKPMQIVARLSEKGEDDKYTDRANAAVELVISTVYLRGQQKKPEDSNESFGFTVGDKRIGTYYGAWILGEKGPNKEGNHLDGRHLRKARKMARKYKKQMQAAIKLAEPQKEAA